MVEIQGEVFQVTGRLSSSDTVDVDNWRQHQAEENRRE